ncbi:hypothetical protein TNCV_1799191 [Trichonephila clavipes]|uniref:Uncharacterized protein n=1 Tax=Trichonephila clavipes TaxID=2585209 RepID=A0A8X6SEQ5_TRICX|nr:hypothetical protein TNCV_1799191 [Trichonephila clavipes]
MGFPTKRSRDFLLCSEKFLKERKIIPFPKRAPSFHYGPKVTFPSSSEKMQENNCDCEFSLLPTTLHPSSIRQLSCWNFYATYRPAPRSIPA